MNILGPCISSLGDRGAISSVDGYQCGRRSMLGVQWPKNMVFYSNQIFYMLFLKHKIFSSPEFGSSLYTYSKKTLQQSQITLKQLFVFIKVSMVWPTSKTH